MTRIRLALSASLLCALLPACSCRNSASADCQRAAAVGHSLAMKLHPDSAPTDMLHEAVILNVRHREAILRQEGHPEAADALSAAFLATLDSISPGIIR